MGCDPPASCAFLGGAVRSQEARAAFLYKPSFLRRFPSHTHRCRVSIDSIWNQDTLSTRTSASCVLPRPILHHPVSDTLLGVISAAPVKLSLESPDGSECCPLWPLCLLLMYARFVACYVRPLSVQPVLHVRMLFAGRLFSRKYAAELTRHADVIGSKNQL